jgi:hypothetical protein
MVLLFAAGCKSAVSWGGKPLTPGRKGARDFDQFPRPFAALRLYVDGFIVCCGLQIRREQGWKIFNAGAQRRKGF